MVIHRLGCKKAPQKCTFWGQVNANINVFYSVCWISGKSIFLNSAPAAVKVVMS